MTIRQKLLRAYAELRSIGAHRIVQTGRSHIWAIVGTLAVCGGLLWLAQRELRSALAWSADAGRPIVLKPIKAERDGDAVHVPRPESVPCPASVVVARTPKGKKALEAIGVDTKKESVLATAEVPPAPYGAETATTIDHRTGLVEVKALVRNPLFARENRFAFGAGVVAAQPGIGATLHVDYEPFSVRGPNGYRFFLRLGADGDLFSGQARPRATALVVLRRP